LVPGTQNGRRHPCGRGSGGRDVSAAANKKAATGLVRPVAAENARPRAARARGRFACLYTLRAMFMAAAILDAGHQAHLQGALTGGGEWPIVVSACCHGVPFLCVVGYAAESVPRPTHEINSAESLRRGPPAARSLRALPQLANHVGERAGAADVAGEHDVRQARPGALGAQAPHRHARQHLAQHQRPPHAERRRRDVA